MPHIPPELVSHILDFVEHPQHDTLCACSLVCSEWLPIAQERLFADVQLYELHPRGNHPTRPQILVGFLDLLMATPGIAFAVKSLSVDRQRCWIPTLPYMALICVLAMLPNLQRLSLENMCLPDAFPNLHGDAPSFALRELRLKGIKSLSHSRHAAASLFKFLDLFPDVGEMELEVSLFNTRDEDFYDSFVADCFHPSRLSMSTLRLTASDLDESIFLRIFSSTPALDNLKNLTFTASQLAYTTRLLSAFLSHERCAIETLTIDFRRDRLNQVYGYTVGSTMETLAIEAFQGQGDQTLGPPLPTLRSLQSLHILFSNVFGPGSGVLVNRRVNEVSAAIINCLPPSGELHLYFGFNILAPFIDDFERMIRRYAGLRRTYVHTPQVAETTQRFKERFPLPEVHCVYWKPE